MRVACVRCSMSPRSPLPQRRNLNVASLWPAFLLVISLAVVAPFISGCGGASIAVDLNTIAAIGSPATNVRVNQTLQLTSSYLASGQAMTFYVNGIAGGNATVGTISDAGVYTAPAVVPTPYTVQITSSIAKYPTAVPGSVSIQVWNPIPVLGTVTPNGFSEGTTTVTVDRLAICLRRADQLERRIGSHHLCLRHRAGGANRRAQPRHLSAHRHQSQSRIGQRSSAFPEGRSRPGRAHASAELRNRRPRLEHSQPRPDGQRNRQSRRHAAGQRHRRRQRESSARRSRTPTAPSPIPRRPLFPRRATLSSSPSPASTIRRFRSRRTSR